jgi:hypothetical protein
MDVYFFMANVLHFFIMILPFFVDIPFLILVLLLGVETPEKCLLDICIDLPSTKCTLTVMLRKARPLLKAL